MALEQYTNILIQLTRDSRNDTNAQLTGLTKLSSLFSDTSDATSAISLQLETQSHLTKAVHRAITSNMTIPRICSIGLRILSHMGHLNEDISKTLLFKENVLETAVETLRTHNGDVGAVRSALCLLTTVLGRANNESATIKFQRIHMIGSTLNAVLLQHIDDAPTVEWGLASCCFVGRYGGNDLPSTVICCIETHPTDLGVVRTGLSACCSLARTNESNRVSLIGCGAFDVARTCLDLRPAHREMTIIISSLIGYLLKSKLGRNSILRGDNSRLVKLLAGCLPAQSDVQASWFPLCLRSVTTALTMVSLSSVAARTLLLDCEVVEQLNEILELKLPNLRLRFDVEMALAAIKGELEEDAKERLFIDIDDNKTIEFGSSSRLNREKGQIMKTTKNHLGTIGMKMGTR